MVTRGIETRLQISSLKGVHMVRRDGVNHVRDSIWRRHLPIFTLSYPSFGASYSGTIGRQRARCVRRMYNTDGGRSASTIYTLTAVPDWVKNVHLLDSEHSITVVQIRGAPISAGPKASVVKSLEAEAYANYFLFTAEDLMLDVTHAMFPRPELIFIYTQMDYEQQEGNNKPLRIPEMILQVRFRL